MRSVELGCRNFRLQIPVIIFGLAADVERSKKVAKQQCLVGELVLLDCGDALKFGATWLPMES
jgi:hypothetical protein